MKRKEEKILIALLEGPKTGKELLRAVEPEKFEKKSQEQGENKAVSNIMSNWFRKNSSSGYMRNLMEDGFLEKIEGGKKYDVNWEGISEFLWEGRLENTSNREEVIETLAERLSEHREILFSLESFYMLYEQDNKPRLPSLRGFINTAIGMVFILDSIVYRMERKKPASERIEDLRTALDSVEKTKQNNLRFIIRYTWKNLTKHGDSTFFKREEVFFRQQKKKYDDLELEGEISGGFWFYLNKIQGVIKGDEYKPEGKLMLSVGSDSKMTRLSGAQGVLFGDDSNMKSLFKPLDQGLIVPLSDKEKRKIRGRVRVCEIVSREEFDFDGNYEGDRALFYEDKAIIIKRTKANSRINKSPNDLYGFEPWMELEKLFK